jgi:thiol-disulfide isomerase/thioredoxin
VSSDDLRGKVVVLNYWATWCGPCRVELPDMDTYMRKHPGAPLAIYAITTEGSLPDSKLKPLAAALSFPLIKKIKGGGYGVLQGVPTNYVIDKAGVVRVAKAGAFSLDSLEETLTPLLAEPAPAVVAATP